MINDARGLEDGAELAADICIVGAGAAGITLARELAGGPLKVCILESGGLTLEPRTQELYRGKNVGWPYYDLDVLRLRYFGGTTNHWSGVCRPLDDIDFAARPWVPLSGWPFRKADLDPYYRRAHELCDLGPYDYSVERWEGPGRPRLPLDARRLETTMCQLSPPTRFGQKYRSLLAQSANIAVYLHANAVDMVPAESGRALSRVRAATLEGTRFTVRAREFVLATGAIENVRLLLVSGGAAGGLGNDRDLVGRYFMEHLGFPAGLLIPASERLSFELYTGYASMDGSGVKGQAYLTLPERVLREERLLNVRSWLPNATELAALRGSSEAVESVFGLIGGLGDGYTAERLEHIESHLDEVAIYGYRRLFAPSALDAHWLYFHMEQPPNRDSRVTLGDERDELGLPRVRLDWEIGDLARDAFKRSARLMAQEIGRAGVGRVKMIVTDPHTGWPTIDSGLRGAWHQMGTTRMHPDPALGVVDADCRLHGFENFYIGGSSVFPTGGYTNPTLTIVALAVRLADHLKSRFA